MRTSFMPTPLVNSLSPAFSDRSTSPISSGDRPGAREARATVRAAADSSPATLWDHADDADGDTRTSAVREGGQVVSLGDHLPAPARPRPARSAPAGRPASRPARGEAAP